LKIAIASGKGGTGKTTVATNLAKVSPVAACYADCDVEEPDGHIFLKPRVFRTTLVTRPIPKVDMSICDLCGKCAEVCRFNAIAVLPHKVMLFDDLCHGCGGCTIACPLEAIHEDGREIGVVEKGKCGGLDFIAGRLHVGESIVSPLVRAVKQELPENGLTILDASPGTSCPVVTAVQGADFCILVTEPTPFGLNDLMLAVQMTRKLGVPFGVVINRDGIGNSDTEDYCKAEGVSILARIPDDRRIAEAYSRGEMIVDAVPGMRDKFLSLLTQIVSRKERPSRDKGIAEQ
jgi:MinD superfamily P-loop ATPase